MRGFFVELLADETGASAVEYGLIAALVSVAAAASFESIGTSLSAMFGSVSSAIQDAYAVLST
ncbi:MAG: Flp family type IVb pilin [Alphaproteobacteria bacterium]|nr:Flp family type IVb pilin [Alphaproteobacteria bacterium]